ncbi:MAG: lysophospholipid acyltransferase family protein, partial [Betaproteobacteria bacterium]|nr:lysophospholipid acyltransferase family protein [Betaproteobacteria bacterium]
MIFLRSLVYLMLLVISVVPYWELGMCVAWLPRVPRWKIIAGWPRLAAWLAIHLLGIRYEVRGRENIPAEPVVILSKHSSAWETLAYSEIFPPHVYVMKRELMWLPFLGWGLALFSPIFIDRADRKNAMRRTVELAKQRLAQGFCIMVYPEGTRIPVGKRGKYKLGGAHVAVQTGARVLPVAHNAGLLWPRNSFLKYPGKVTVVIGEPIDSAGQTPEQLMRKVEDWIESQVEILLRAERA